MARPPGRARHAASPRGAAVPRHAAAQAQPLPRVAAGVGVALAVGLTVTGVQAAVTSWEEPAEVAGPEGGEERPDDAAREAEETSRLRTGDGVDITGLPERLAADLEESSGGEGEPTGDPGEPSAPASAPEPSEPAPAEPSTEPSDEPSAQDVAPPGGEELAAAFREEVVELTNAERAAGGCDALEVDEELATAAQLHAEDMVVQQYFSHTGLDGSTPTDRASASGYDGGAGENIAAGQPSPADVVDGWMASEGHRENILTCEYTVIGVGYDDGRVDPEYGPGSWVQMFGFGE